jgi:hypothetical protein
MLTFQCHTLDNGNLRHGCYQYFNDVVLVLNMQLQSNGEKITSETTVRYAHLFSGQEIVMSNNNALNFTLVCMSIKWQKMPLTPKYELLKYNSSKAVYAVRTKRSLELLLSWKQTKILLQMYMN